MKKNKITLEELAKMVARGFEQVASKEEIDQRFDQVDQRFDDIERKIDKVDLRVDQVYEILERDEKDFLRLRKKVQTLEKIVKIPHS